MFARVKFVDRRYGDDGGRVAHLLIRLVCHLVAGILCLLVSSSLIGDMEMTVVGLLIY